MNTIEQITALVTAAKDRADAATKGPWKKCEAHDGKCQCLMIWTVPHDAVIAEAVRNWGDGVEGTDSWMEYGSNSEESVQANKEFIAAARTDVPNFAEALLIAVSTLAGLADPSIQPIGDESESALSKILAKLQTK